MKIITINVNGIRSAGRYGLFEWLAKQSADIICLQEIKAHLHQLEDELFCPTGYHCYYHCAEKKGYSGVAIYSRLKPAAIHMGLGIEWVDIEGRYLQADYEKFSVVSLYLPSGTSGKHRQLIKYQMMDVLWQHLQTLKLQGRELIICGDWNIAHKPQDLKNWRNNQKNSGFLPEERAWLDQIFSDNQFVDALRVIHPNTELYTWWSNRGQAYAKNVGWRIDYQVVTPGLRQYISSVAIYKEQRFSDHAPLIIEYNMP